MTDVCLPVYRNLKCLRMAARGLRAFVFPVSCESHCPTGGSPVLPSPVSCGSPVLPVRVWLHVQDAAETAAVLQIFTDLKMRATVVSEGQKRDMAEVMDILFAAGTAPVVIMMEQDTFLYPAFGEWLRSFPALHEPGTAQRAVPTEVAGPLDMLYMPARPPGMDRGDLVRMCPRPGYMHSSLMVLSRAGVAAMAQDGGRETEGPFTAPEGTKYWGTGLLGAEPYYGLCEWYYINGYGHRLEFWEQHASSFGMAADILPNNPHPGPLPFPNGRGNALATHLFYSGTRAGYVKDGAITAETAAWLEREEDRFLEWYEKDVLF